MSMLPAAPLRAGNLWGIRAVRSSVAFSALSLFITTTAFAAETPASILKKMTDVYTKAKFYQVSVTTLQTGKTPAGLPFTVTQTERIQYQSPNMFHKSVKLAGGGAAATGQGAQQLALRQGEIYSDGKTATMYVPSRKMYQKQPVPPAVQLAQLVDLLRLIPPGNKPGLTLLPTGTTVHGRSAYIIEIQPVTPPKLNAAQLKTYQASLKQFKQFPRFTIDKQNFSLLEYSLVTTTGNAQVSLSSQVFGGSIPSNSFTFVAPAGSKEFVAPKAPPGGPGAPGGLPGGVPGAIPGGGGAPSPLPGGGKLK
jgi:outer membrane lipoprotein-sorting protein